MKKLKLLLAGAVAVMAVSCVLDPVPGSEEQTKTDYPDVFSKAIPTGYYATVNLTVPAATNTVYIEYRDANGKKTTVEQAVTPKVQTPADGKDAEPFGVVSLLLKSQNATTVNVYYKLQDAATKASDDDEVILIDDFPLDQITSGEFGKTRYVQVTWEYPRKDEPVNEWYSAKVPSYPADVVVYDAEHNHTLRYKFAYSGIMSEGYMLDEAYEIENYVVKSVKNKYCSSCGDGCPYCMPWGCSCGCGGWDNDGNPVVNPNPNFVPNGNQLEQALADGAQTPEEAAEIPEDVEVVDLNDGILPEPKTYVTTDGDYTMYHSSGVVMFDDSWPALPQVGVDGKAILDYNDMVVDYDIEAVTVSDARLASEGWREQVKVVLHVRALGSKSIYRVGMSLDNFNTDYVQSVSEYKTLDSWQNEHGELPAYARAQAFQENSIHYDAVSGTEFTRNTNRPAVEIGQLQGGFNGTKWNAGAGKDVYVYKGEHGLVEEHVMNPALKMYAAWGGPHEEQYRDELKDVKEPETLASMQKYTFYNTVPGYVNVTGGLYTYTVIYHMKPRADMDPVQREAAKQNMIEAVYNNMAQNFFVVKQDFAPIGLKGYQPLDYKTKDNRCYADKYQEFFNKNADHLDADVTYKASNGQVWAFKCPTLTRHTWERMYFSNAYPHFKEWVLSNGAEAQDWYKRDVDYTYLTCQW